MTIPVDLPNPLGTGPVFDLISVQQFLPQMDTAQVSLATPVFQALPESHLFPILLAIGLLWAVMAWKARRRG